MVATAGVKATVLDPQEPTVTDQLERIVIYEGDEVLLDTADPSTYLPNTAGDGWATSVERVGSPASPRAPRLPNLRRARPWGSRGRGALIGAAVATLPVHMMTSSSQYALR